jgi:hypothetical protein
MSDEARADNGTQVLPAESTRASAADPLKIAEAFQRKIFGTQDSRLSHLDALGGIVVAAAIAVATFTGSLMKNEDVSIAALSPQGCFVPSQWGLPFMQGGSGQRDEANRPRS